MVLCATQARRPWFFNATRAGAAFVVGKPLPWGRAVKAKRAGVQVGGFLVGYDTGGPLTLQFVTVRNSGHMTPAYAPRVHTACREEGVAWNEWFLVGITPFWEDPPHSRPF